SLSLGLHTITAAATNSGPLTGSAQIHLNVASGPQIVLLGPLDLTVTGLGDSLTFSAIAFDFEDGDLSSRLTWTSSRDGAIGTGGNITVTTLRSGTHTITASSSNRRGLTGQKTITIVVNDPPVVTITAPADGARSVQGTPVTLSASATDREDA